MAMSNTIEQQYPCCEKCETNYDVYCMECETHSVNCTCVTLEFWCDSCKESFVWDIAESNERRLEDVIDEMDEILDVKVENANSCPNCYTVKAHECFDILTGEIFEWAGTGEIVPTCTCTPTKCYICAKCNVVRDSEDEPWEARPNDGHTLAELHAMRQEAKEKALPAPKCYCTPEESYFCGKCRVTRSVPTAEWKEVEGYQQAVLNRLAGDTASKPAPLPKATAQTKVPYTGGTSATSKAWSDWDDDYQWMGLYKCRHYGEPVKLPDGTTVHCSSLWDQRKEAKDYPDKGLYFDWSWKPDWRSELSLWPDFGAPTNLKATADAIKEHYELAKKGFKIEIGCIGGHGRTGTALACMLVLAGVPVAEAGSWVKTNYCKAAIESEVQWWYIKWFDAFINGKPLPEKPVYKAPTPVVYCTMGEHYVQFLANPTSTVCTKRKKACTSFYNDFKKFGEGKVEAHVLKSALELKSFSDYNNIDGYKVPKSKAGDVSHNRNKADCACDYCRYRRKGMIALLEPVGVTHVYIQTPNAIIKTDVTPDFTPQPPKELGNEIGERIGEYVWNVYENQEVWVWDAIKRAKSRYIRENAERNKKAGGTVPAMQSATATAKKVVDTESVGDYSDNKKSNKRNKKNSKRNGGRRRDNRRRR